MTWLSRLSLLLVTLTGCADRTGLLVEVTSSDLSVPADVDALVFVAEASTGRRVEETHALTGTWPYSLTIVPHDDADLRATLTLRVSGMQEGEIVVRRIVHDVPFIEGETRRVVVELQRSCVGVSCPEGVDCVAGMCVGETTDGGVDGGPPDAGIDAGTDAGMDAGREEDAGADSGPRDAGATVPVVISELATGGPGGGTDEFVELYNASDAPVSIGGLVLEYLPAGGGTWSTRTTVPASVTIPVRGFYLMAATGYARSPGADLPSAWTTGLAGSGGHVRILVGGVELDRLGWGPALMPEGTAQPALSTGEMSSGSYERKAFETSTAAMMEGGAHAASGNGWDSNDNASDFIHRSVAGPQSTASAPEIP